MHQALSLRLRLRFAEAAIFSGQKSLISEDAVGGGKKRGEENLTSSTPLRCQCSVLPVQKIHDGADQKLFGRGPKIFGRARSLVRFPPPIRFAPPDITAQLSILACPHAGSLPLQVFEEDQGQGSAEGISHLVNPNFEWDQKGYPQKGLGVSMNRPLHPIFRAFLTAISKRICQKSP